MKRYLLIILCVLLACPISWGTGQQSDIIVLDGEEWQLLEAPLGRLDSLTYHQLQDTFKWESYSTANWRGYVAYWSLFDGLLYLDKVIAYDENLVTIDCDYGIICGILERYVKNGKVCASWFSDEMIAGKGGLVRYDHMGFNRDYEEEIVISVVQGTASLSQVYHNHSGLGPQEETRLNAYLKDFPTDGYVLEKGRYLLRIMYDAESSKWIAKLYRPPVLTGQDALEKGFTDYFNAYDGEIRDYIRGEWVSSRVFIFPIVI